MRLCPVFANPVTFVPFTAYITGSRLNFVFVIKSKILAAARTGGENIPVAVNHWKFAEKTIVKLPLISFLF